MNKNSLEQFIEDAKKVTLGAEEKSLMREGVWVFIKKNPVRKVGEIRQIMEKPHESVTSRGPILFFIGNLTLSRITVCAVLFLSLLVSGTSYAAEGSLPGDFLYPIKVNMNEEVRGLFVFSVNARAGWEVARVERRLEEAEHLAVRGKFGGGCGGKYSRKF